MQTGMDLRESIELRRAEALERLYDKRIRISVGMGTCGLANGAAEVFDAISSEVSASGLDWSVRPTGCVGFCQVEPVVDVLVPGLPRIFYAPLPAEKASRLVKDLAAGNFHTEWALMRADEDMLLLAHSRKLKPLPQDLSGIAPLQDTPFYRRQTKLALRNCGFIDPLDIDEYIASGGYHALASVITSMSPDDVIDAVDTAGLRGRGGGGFATARKWRACRRAEGSPKYVLCNGDEGDPGAFMDRSIMEGNPFSVLEGMAVGAYAIGSDRGYIYVRLEYPLAVRNLRAAIATARDNGFLGNNILGADFSFDVQISRGAGAFVCGESTALMASIEGFSGEPRAKHIHTSEKGLFQLPTNLNNVETWANVPVIINKGPDWFSEIGSENSKGTKVFSLVGKVKNTGLVEVPMGATLREIIFDIGGGVPKGRTFKAVQTGGPSGGCLPESRLDLPVDFDRLAEAGSMMGSGGMIVMDDHTCMVEIARYFTEFLCRESCGKCTACREGVLRMYQLLEKITLGQATPEDIDLLEEVSLYVRDNSICGLGKSAPNPTLSTLRYFRDEYDAHVVDHRCPAGVCRALTTFEINPELCKACGLCVKQCPTDAITGGQKKVNASIDQDKCITCGSCRDVCPFGAVAAV